MRSGREIRFRLWQQVQNARLLAIPPKLSRDSIVSALPLPDARKVAQALRGSPYATETITLADSLLAHRFPLLGSVQDTGPTIEWRKDYASGRVTGTDYFRLIPYLDFSKAGDHKNIWELNRHQHLVLLAQAFLLSEDTRYLLEIDAQLESWFSQNPFLRGINFASALEVAFRALSWLWIDHLVGGQLQPDLQRKLQNALFQHGHFLEANLSTYFSPNTHLLGEGVALHALGLKFPKTGWERLGHRILAEERDRQIQADGSHFEQSTYYHVYALDFFLFYYLLAGRPVAFEQSILKMARFLAAVNGPAGLLAFFGDDDGGRLFHPFNDRAAFGRATLTTCAQLFPDQEVPVYPDTMPQMSSWWIGDAQVKFTSPDVPDSAVLFPDSGLVSITRNSLHLLIDTGPFGPGGAGHSHSDTLSFTIRSGSRELLIDPGTFTYVADPHARDEFRGSGYHNTVRVDRRDQADPVKPFRWENKPAVTRQPVREEGERVYVDATCSYRGIAHRRRYTLIGSHVLFLLDQLSGPEGEHEFEQFWHLGSDAEPAMVILSSASFPPTSTEGWRSQCLGTKERSPVLVYQWRARFPVELGTALVFNHQQPLAPLELRRESNNTQLAIAGFASVEFPDA